mgnify:CR=1 FL=1|tara:strand:- start:5418 stop:6836 length:1419 start_codon:yes stop_codon:yes gene_type:complete
MNSFILKISSLFFYQFLFEPLQYFIIETTPSIYLGRLISLLIIGALIYTNKSALLIRSFIKSLTTFPFLPYTLWTVTGGIVALIHYQEPFYKIRFGIIEPLIYLIFITLFIILPKSFLREELLFKIPKALLYTFSFLLIFGFLDLICYYFGFNLLNKSLFNTREIGARFHSFANEPRDYVVACLYYLASLSTFFVSPLLGNTFKKYFKFYLIILIPLAILSLILTKSFTFIVTASIGLIVLGFTILVKSIISLFEYKLYKSYIGGILIGFILFLSLYLSLNSDELLQSLGLERIFSYLESFDQLRIYLKEGNSDFVKYLKEIDIRLFFQGSVILPLLEFLFPSNGLDIFYQFVGNGIGSTTDLLKIINEDDTLQNSFSQGVRLLYEQGIVGFLFFIYIHFSIIKNSTLSINSTRLQKSLFFIFSTFLLIAYLVHRRSEYFLFLGITQLFLYDKFIDKKIKNINIFTRIKKYE